MRTTLLGGADTILFVRYGEWLGLVPSWVRTDEEGKTSGRCIRPGADPAEAPSYCGVLQGDWGWSTVFKEGVGGIILNPLG